jgi:CRISPR-associated protein Csh2
MSNSFKNRVFGCAIIKSINSNYNADFSHQPRTLPDGVVYATDKTLKYSIRNYWDKVLNEKVFYFKSLNDKMQPRTLDEKYLQLFEKFKTTITSDKFCLFYFNGENIEGIIPNQPKSPQVKKILKGLGEESELKNYEQHLKFLATKDVQVISSSEIKNSFEEEDEEFYFYVDKNKSIKKIDGEKSEIETLCGMLIEAMGGGINRKEHMKDMLSCLDVRLFGGTYAGKTNISIHGTCQITHGVNRFPENVIYSEQIMSPFRNPSEKNVDSTMTTLGTQSKLKEGHYVHHFSINPQNIAEDAKRVQNEGLIMSDIDKLKEALRKGVSYYDSAAKSGTENELLLWVQLKEDSKIVLPSFVELVTVSENREIELIKIKELLAKSHIKSEIEKIELYYNKGITKVINAPEGAIEIEL